MAERQAGESNRQGSTGRGRKHKPEGQIIHSGFDDTLTVVSKTGN